MNPNHVNGAGYYKARPYPLPYVGSTLHWTSGLCQMELYAWCLVKWVPQPQAGSSKPLMLPFDSVLCVHFGYLFLLYLFLLSYLLLVLTDVLLLLFPFPSPPTSPLKTSLFSSSFSSTSLQQSCFTTSCFSSSSVFLLQPVLLSCFSAFFLFLLLLSSFLTALTFSRNKLMAPEFFVSFSGW